MRNDILTGYNELDSIIEGLKQPSLVVLGSRPAMGKTTLAFNILRNISNISTASYGLISYELSQREIQKRFKIMDPEFELDTGSLGNTLHYSLIENLTELAKDGCQIIFVDYLQILPEFSINRYEEVSVCIQNLKKFAMDWRCCIFVTSQLSRKIEERQGHIPRLTDFRESGCIEEAADLVLALSRREYYDPMDKPGLADLYILKNRLGKTGKVQLSFQKENLLFSNYIPIKSLFD